MILDEFLFSVYVLFLLFASLNRFTLPSSAISIIFPFSFGTKSIEFLTRLDNTCRYIDRDNCLWAIQKPYYPQSWWLYTCQQKFALGIGIAEHYGHPGKCDYFSIGARPGIHRWNEVCSILLRATNSNGSYLYFLCSNF